MKTNKGSFVKYNTNSIFYPMSVFFFHFPNGRTVSVQHLKNKEEKC